MKTIKLLPIILFAALSSGAQSLPDEMYFTPDGRMLMTGGQQSTGLYDPSVIKNVYLDFPQANYWTLLTQNYQSKTDLPATMTIDGLTLDSVGVRFKGMTSYMQASNSEKKSFNITTNSFIGGQKWNGYTITNFNNCFQDASFLREVFYQSQIRKHIPAAKSAFIKLYINGANWGVYPNVQQINKDFLKEWFMNNDGSNWRADRPSGAGGPGGGGWGDGTAALNYHGNDTADYQTYYTLKSTKIAQPWNDLVTVCHVLDTISSASAEAVLNQYMDLDRTLWYLGSEILFSDDDSYVYKGKMDYYVYQDEFTGRMTPLEYDGNSALESNAVNWSPFYNQNNANYPLMNKLFAIPSIRQRYLAHMRTLIAEELDSASAIQSLDNFKAMIDTMVQNDPKKLYTYAQFTSEVEELKDFVLNRRNYLMSNTEVNVPVPQISDVKYISQAGEWTSPVANEDVTVLAHASATPGIDHLTLYYATGIYGSFENTLMYDDGAHNDSAASDGIYGGVLPGQSSGQWVRFYIQATASNTAQTVAYSPVGAEHDVYVYQVTLGVASNIKITINEVMASNTVTAADSAGQYDDWIELYNLSGSDEDISGYYLTDNSLNLIKWQFPAGTVIPANGYLIVWMDEDESQGDLHANFKLSGSGEHLLLLNSNLEIVDDVTFQAQTTDMGYARVPNGTGSFIIQLPTFNGNNNSTGITTAGIATTGISVYPNPANDHLKIYVSSEKEEIKIFNAQGKLVVSDNSKNVYEFDIAAWSNGMYLVRVGNSCRKIVVQH